MLDIIKKALRMSNTTFDDDIANNIDTALLELGRVGVNVNNLSSKSTDVDFLIVKACELYCKAQLNFIGKGEQFEQNFNALRDALSVTSQYTEVAE